MVPVDVPVIGGLAFRMIDLGAAVRVSTGAIDVAHLVHLAATLSPGDTFVDDAVRSDGAVFVVAAALLVGANGCVRTTEPDPARRALLAHNLERHRVAHLVEVRSV